MFDYATYLSRLQAGDTTINPFLAFLDIRLDEISTGFARFHMAAKPEYLQGAGLVQGGLMVALADETIAHAIMSVLKGNEGLTTVELKSNFLAPVKNGTLTAEATVFKKGRSIIVGDCLIRDDQERQILRCTATFLVVAEKTKPSRKDEETPPADPAIKKENDRQANLF
ncbi:MAG: PaaI family thioesterase [Deltaproteobacteria bacterium]|nr:PaaI family thioesterase [Deltaproteobacteria bacterium]